MTDCPCLVAVLSFCDHFSQGEQLRGSRLVASLPFGDKHMRRKKVETMIKTMTENEKTLTQARHRLEEAQARNRVKEHKARTRRLIQEGAILEKLLPQISGI